MATCARKQRADAAARSVILLVAAGMLTRRAWGLIALLRSRRWYRRRLASIPSKVGRSSARTLHVIVPLYEEQAIVADTLQFWRDRCEVDPELRVLLITTEKEGRGDGSTARVVEKWCNAEPHPRLVHMHAREQHPFRAPQLNLAVDSVATETANRADAWVGVYNADSRPSASTFNELRQAIAVDPRTRAYQQLVRYVPPTSGRVAPMMHPLAALQTWWTYTTYFARNRRGAARWRWWSATSPFSTFGHGEFFRLDLLREIGDFPDFAYADGLLVGWLIRFRGEPIGLLASPDFAGVPRNVRDLLSQHRAWMRGLVNVAAAARESPSPQGASEQARRSLLLLSHLAIPLGWGTRPLYSAAALAWSTKRLRDGRDRAASLFVLLALGGFAEIPQLLAGRDRRRSLAGRLIFAPLTLFVDGLGLGPALLDAAIRPLSAPRKTPR